MKNFDEIFEERMTDKDGFSNHPKGVYKNISYYWDYDETKEMVIYWVFNERWHKFPSEGEMINFMRTKMIDDMLDEK